MRDVFRTINMLITERLTYLYKWVILASAVGIVSGVGAIIFKELVEFSTYFFLGTIMGYRVDAGSGAITIERSWLIPIVVGVGGILSGIITYTLAPETEGHGTDSVIKSIHRLAGEIRSRVPIVKAVSTAFTLGSGGSAGKEGPIAQIGAGFGSLLGSLLKLSSRDRKILVVCGVAGGIGSVFKAPFGAGIFSVEVLYLQDIEVEAIIPAFISSIIAYVIFASVYGTSHMFSLGNVSFNPIVELPFYFLLGIVLGVSAIAYIKVFYAVHFFFKKLRIKDHVKPAIGGLIAGLIGIAYPRTLGSGYEHIQLALTDKLPYFDYLTTPIFKILATAFTIGSGGSGGVFAPSLVIGGLLGGAFAKTVDALIPGANLNTAAFIIIGMMSFFAAAGKVPLASIIMVAEMTGGYELMVPAIVSSTIAYIISMKTTIYINQIPHRLGEKLVMLEDVYNIIVRSEPYLLQAEAEKIMVKPIAVLKEDMRIKDALKMVSKYNYRVYPIVDGNGIFTGYICLEELITASRRARDLSLEYMRIHSGLAFSKHTPLKKIIDEMINHGVDKVFITDDNGKLIGIITIKDILRFLTHKEIK